MACQQSWVSVTQNFPGAVNLFTLFTVACLLGFLFSIKLLPAMNLGRPHSIIKHSSDHIVSVHKKKKKALLAAAATVIDTAKTGFCVSCPYNTNCPWLGFPRTKTCPPAAMAGHCAAMRARWPVWFPTVESVCLKERGPTTNATFEESDLICSPSVQAWPLVYLMHRLQQKHSPSPWLVSVHAAVVLWAVGPAI